MRLEEIGKKEKFKVSRMARLYTLEDGNVLKLFKNSKELYEIDRYKYMLNYNNESFVFPFEFIYDSEKFYGYITKRVYADTLESIFFKSDLLKLSSNSIKLEKNINYISKGGIVLYDFHNENILYDDKNYSVIDHDENAICRNEEYAKTTNQNYHRIVIGNLFLENIENNKHTKLIKDKISKYKYMKIKPSEMIIRIKEDIDKQFNTDINKIEDLNNIFRR